MVLTSEDTVTTAILIAGDINSSTALVTGDTIETTVIVEDKEAAETLSREDTAESTPAPVNFHTRALFLIPDSDSVPSKIEEGLYLGSIKAALNKDELKKLNITHIIGVLALCTPAYPDEFTYKTIGIYDNAQTNIQQYFDDCFKYIEEAKSRGGGVFVHCYMGMSRSATIIIAYMMKKHGMSLSEALKQVKAKRPKVMPNSGFMLQLQQFENYLQDAHASALTLSLPFFSMNGLVQYILIFWVANCLRTNWYTRLHIFFYYV